MPRLTRYLVVAMIGLFILSGFGCTDTGKTTPDTDKTTVQTGVDIGDTAPDFDLRNQDQIKISLTEFKGKKNVVLVFYPADFTPV